MLFKIINNNIMRKTVALVLSIYLILSIFAVSYAENYEWSVINNIETIETNGPAEYEESSGTENQTNNTANNSKNSLNLDCGSAILIEQNSRSNFIRAKRPRKATPSKCYKINDTFIDF